MNSIITAWDMIHRAQAEAMERLIEAWDKEIEAEFQRLREQAQELNQQKLAEAADARREYLSDQRVVADTARAASYLIGLVDVAQDNDASAVSVPGGLPPGVATQLSSLISAVQSEVAEGRMDSPVLDDLQSIASGNERGMLGQLRELEALLGANQHQGYAQSFGALADRIEKFVATELFSNPAIKYHMLKTEPGKSPANSQSKDPTATGAVNRALDLFQGRSPKS